MGRRGVVTVLSSNYSGSHFLSLLLGSHSSMAHLGEVRRMHDGRWPSVCTRCGDQMCPVITGVAERPVEETYAQIFENLSRMERRVDVLIDTSKSLGWAKKHVHSEYRLRYIHLVRDPRALVRRWLQRDPGLLRRVKERAARIREQPRVAPIARLAIAEYPMLLAYQWLSENKAITRFLKDNECVHRVVTYRDLALDTASTVRSITEWIGLPFEESQLSYWQHEHHGTTKLEYAWVAEQQRTGYFDDRWMHELEPQIVEAVRRDQYLLAYVESLGLTWVDDGLTRAPTRKA